MWRTKLNHRFVSSSVARRVTKWAPLTAILSLQLKTKQSVPPSMHSFKFAFHIIYWRTWLWTVKNLSFYWYTWKRAYFFVYNVVSTTATPSTKPQLQLNPRSVLWQSVGVAEKTTRWWQQQSNSVHRGLIPQPLLNHHMCSKKGYLLLGPSFGTPGS